MACTIPSPRNQWYVAGSGEIGFGPLRSSVPRSSLGMCPVIGNRILVTSVSTGAKFPDR